MTNKTELLPCPFCGTQPPLPDGDGTQYEISCEECGGAVASVQICDLMTLEERASDSFKDYRYGEEFVERAKLEAIDKWNTRAAPAEDVRAVVEEPVGYALDSMLKRIKDNPSFGHMIFGSPNGAYDVPLYRHPQRPVVLPERKHLGDPTPLSLVEGWNACLDAVEELNK
ncbi:Lar family restriction alleviation protein [Pseudomonas sp. PS02290]|uniref:Lar family restriction alleviation protein n=1 Tax=Pseudomonas sp. PS02290 TaxID=2991430 RepID=UPI00249C1FF9|nr:Lar family restriction alleviation protein [Pseudomonas sp. PS02290]